MRIKLSGNVFRAAMNVAAKNDTRYHLCGFYLDVGENKLVTTDGHRLITVPYTVEDPSSPTGTKYVEHPSDGGAPTGDIKRANFIYSTPAKLPPKTGTVLIDTLDTGSNVAKVTYLDRNYSDIGNYMCTRIDSKFPDYKEVLPRDLGGEASAIAFNPKYLWDIAKEAKPNASVRLDFSKRDPSISPIKVTIADDDFADVLYVLMPVRL